MAGVSSEIISWAKTKLRPWEQLALYKIMSEEDFTDETYQALLNYLLIDEGLFR